MSKKKSVSKIQPIFIAIGVILGILIGCFYSSLYSGNNLSIINASGNKLNDLLYIIDDQYVDTINIEEIVEKSLPKILKELDPHSVYISSKDAEQSMQELKGSFSGIGIQFFPYKDTIRITSIIKGGPSESAGLKAGDRIVQINGQEYVGEKVQNNEETMKLLKGKQGSTVALGVKRNGVDGILNFEIIRGEVPVKTVNAVYMINDTVGYINIGSFGETTYPEFLAALAKLNQHDFRNLIIDLRNNLGGYMAPAIQIANEFLPEKRLVVYTEGRKSPREDYYSDGRGTYQSIPLIILLDETTASASEILAGAIQDNDRGKIIGRRSFGKGLVQIPINFNDGSILRITKARYYTPSGRCLQKPYVPGLDEEYEQDLIKRAEHGEYYSQDSIKNSGKEYHTLIGRTVFGGGGIVPDVFIAKDTLGITPYFKEIYMRGLLHNFSFEYVDLNRNKLENLESFKDVELTLSKDQVFDKFIRFADSNGVKRRNLMINESKKIITQYLITQIINDAWGNEKANVYANETDPMVIKALDIIRHNETFPHK